MNKEKTILELLNRAKNCNCVVPTADFFFVVQVGNAIIQIDFMHMFNTNDRFSFKHNKITRHLHFVTAPAISDVRKKCFVCDISSIILYSNKIHAFFAALHFTHCAINK